MRKLLDNRQFFFFLLIISLLLFSTCDNFSFGEDLRSRVEDDVSVTYTFYEYPDLKANHISKKYLTGKYINKESFPLFVHEDDEMIAGWLYLKNYNKPDAKLPQNIYTNRKNYINSITVANSSESFYAVWKKKCTVTFVTNCDIVINKMDAPIGEMLDWPEIEQRHNKKLLCGWYKDPDLKNQFCYDDIVTGDMTLYAKWVEYKTITYYKNDGSKNKYEIDYPVDSPQIINDCQFGERKDYGFAGWSTNKNGNVEYNYGDVINPPADMSLYAVWTKDIVTITYVDTSGNFEKRTARYGRGAYISVGRVLDEKENYFRNLYDVWRKDGKYLAGFSTTPDAVAPYEFDAWGNYDLQNGNYSKNAYQVNNDIIFYGHMDDVTFVVHFYKMNSFGNYSLDDTLTQTLSWNQTVIKPADPALIAGYTFEYWCQGEWGDGNPVLAPTAFDFNTPLNDDTLTGRRYLNLFTKYASGGISNGAASGTISFTEISGDEIDVKITKSSNIIKLEVISSGFSDYKWTIDYEEKTSLANHSAITIDASTMSKGHHDILLIAYNGSEYRSWSGQLDIN